jgi:hypothetical protein
MSQWEKSFLKNLVLRRNLNLWKRPVLYLGKSTSILEIFYK